MPSTDSGNRQKVDGMRRNHWPTSSGLGGRHAPDSVATFGRITHKINTNKLFFLDQCLEGIILY
jgi:hypothetical protein